MVSYRETKASTIEGYPVPAGLCCDGDTMVDTRRDIAVHGGPRQLRNPSGITALLTESGTLERLEAAGTSVLLFPANPLADGAGGLWLRSRTPLGIDPVSLLGQNAPTSVVSPGASTADRAGRTGDLMVTLGLRLAERETAWFWHVAVTNRGPAPTEVDLVHVQDVALASLGAVRSNEYYVSQYLDLTPVEVPGHGTAIGVRQNMPGPTPWLLVGCLGVADRWATDIVQLTGRGRPEGAPWPGLRAELPAARVQGEHSAVALQTEPVVLRPGDTWITGFFGVFRTDHPAATSADDVRHARAVLDDPAALMRPEPVEGPSLREVVDHHSLFGTAAPLPARPLTGDELDQLAGPERIEAEHDGSDLLSFFTADGGHVVTAAKQARVLRPHGHLLRSGTRLRPEETSVCATAWMDGAFCTQLTQGHVSLGTVTSVRRSYLGLDPASGLRIFVRSEGGDGWALLGTPSAWRVALDECRWWYAHGRSLLEVRTQIPAAADAVTVELAVRSGPPVEVLAATQVPWLDPDDGPGAWTAEPDGVRVVPPDGGATLAMFPGAALHLDWTAGSGRVADDGPLFRDGRSRGLPWVTVSTGPRTDWRLTLRPELVSRADGPAAEPDFWSRTAGAFTLDPPDSAAGRELARIGTALPWFVHDAVIHYLSPRGLEQYTGGAWGTRDVSQGPVALLLSLGAYAELRDLVLLIYRAQNARGDWPQAFDFLDRHRRPGQDGAHGDVVYWPLLALGQYLAATGDGSILTELAERVRTALDHIETTLIAPTGLPAYGHGDWNDSLQPVDPELAARMCSTWTGVLQTHALATLSAELTRFAATRDLGERAGRIARVGVADLRRLLLVDGVLAGYGLFGDGGAVEPLIHPRDTRTGLRYSLLPMIHAIADDLLTPDEAWRHLDLIAEHLRGPDGARLFDRPVGYAGGPMTLFQRAEASTFFGREIGLMYMHAHLRYAEALARVGDGSGLLRALALAQPVGMTDRVPAARPRQSTCYYSSSDAAFPDRYAADADYGEIADGNVALEGGWRVYSSGPGLFVQLVVQHQLGLRVAGALVQIDPVLDPDLDGLVVRVPLLGRRRTVRFAVGPHGYGVVGIRAGDAVLATSPLTNPYRESGVAVRADDLRGLDEETVLEVETG